MNARIKALHNIRHDGVRYVTGSVIEEISFESAERLVKLGAAEILSVDAGGPGKLPETPKTAESKPAESKQCTYVKRDGTRCTREAEPGKEYCRVCKLTVAKMAKRIITKERKISTKIAEFNL